MNQHESKCYEKKAVPLSLARRIARNEQKKFFNYFMKVFQPTNTTTVLDLGVNGNPKSRSDCFFEYYYPYKSKITAAGLEDSIEFTSAYPEISYVQIDRSCKLPFKDKEFDVVFCNAVIEHVGNREMQRQFLSEIIRVGGGMFVTTPNRWHPIEFHTVLPLLHWLPVKWHRKILRFLGFDFFSKEENLNLLTQKEFRALLPNDVKAKFKRYWFLLFVSNLILYFRKF